MSTKSENKYRMQNCDMCQGLNTKDITLFQTALQEYSVNTNNKESDFLSVLPQLICYLDKNLILRYANEAFMTFMSKDKQEVIGLHMEEIIGRSFYLKCLPKIITVFKGKPIKYLGKLQFENNMTQWIECNLIPDMAEDGGLKGIYGVFHNLTDILPTHHEQAESLKDKKNNFNHSNNEEIWSTDKEMHINYLNSKDNIFGYTARERLNTKLTQLLSFESAKVLRKFYRAAIKHGNETNSELPVISLELQAYHKNGQIVDILLEANLVYDIDGNLMGMMGTTRDISLRKNYDRKLKKQNEELENTSQALRKSQTMYESLVKNMQMGLLVLKSINNGDDFKFVEINCAAESFFGIDRREIEGRNFKEVMAGEDEVLLNEIRKVNFNGLTSSIPPTYYNHKKRDGWREYFIYKIATGEVVVFIDDVTYVKEKEAKFDTIASHIDEVIWLYEKDKVHYVNHAFERLFHLDTWAFKKNPDLLWNMIHPEDKHLMNRIQNDNQDIFDEQLQIILPTGEEKWIWCKTFPVSGMPNYRVGIVKDISRQKAYENEILFANQEMDNFVYRVSHDLRSPISSSLGLIGLIKNEKNIDTIRHYTNLQEQSLIKLDKFIKDILDYSRNGRIESKKEKVNVDELLDEVMGNLKMPEYQHIKFDLQKNMVDVIYCDPLRIRIVMNNLVSNAFKYHNTYRDDPSVKVELKKKGTKIVIRVSDNGMGIAEEHLNKVFNMFYRANNSCPGSGVGLYIVAEAVKKMSGKVFLQSKEGEGSCFTVELPYSKVPKSVDA